MAGRSSRKKGSRVWSVRWIGSSRATRELLRSYLVTWEDDPWAQGGYAYFDPDFDPAWRPWLARPHGRILFAGEQTSIKWQGYMNGAVKAASVRRRKSWRWPRGSDDLKSQISNVDLQI